MKVELYKWWAYFGVTMFLLISLGLLINIAFFDILTLTYLFAGYGLAAISLIKLAKTQLSSKETSVVKEAKARVLQSKVRKSLEYV